MNGEGADQVSADQTKRLTGRIAVERIKLMELPRPPQGALARLVALGDATGIISDTMDELGIAAPVIGASVLRPTIPGRTIAGPTVEINGRVQIGDVRVAPGDLVVADDTGVCFIPRDVVLEVLDAAEQKAKAEALRRKAIDDGVPVPDISRATYGEK